MNLRCNKKNRVTKFIGSYIDKEAKGYKYNNIIMFIKETYLPITLFSTLNLIDY